mmetsp:Transcript_7728/g.8780  ORF Transcript_7728/g.8780 Transcript_7728/m.8780 type:complete len:89 (-) Transcript_7728:63-329(-)
MNVWNGHQGHYEVNIVRCWKFEKVRADDLPEDIRSRSGAVFDAVLRTATYSPEPDVFKYEKAVEQSDCPTKGHHKVIHFNRDLNGHLN